MSQAPCSSIELLSAHTWVGSRYSQVLTTNRVIPLYIYSSTYKVIILSTVVHYLHTGSSFSYSSTYRVISLCTILPTGSSLYLQLYIQVRHSAERRDVSTFHWIYRFLVVSSEFLLTRLNELWKKNLVFPAVKGILQWNVASANTYYGCCYQGCCNKPKAVNIFL